MTAAKPPFHGSPRFVAASTLLDVTGEALTAIKENDNLTWREIGTALGVGDDQAARYGKGNAEMGFTAYLRACQHWNGRFSIAATKMGLSVAPANLPNAAVDARQGMLYMTLLLAELQQAMLDDTLEDDEIAAMDPLIEKADQFLETMRARVAKAREAAADLREA